MSEPKHVVTKTYAAKLGRVSVEANRARISYNGRRVAWKLTCNVDGTEHVEYVVVGPETGAESSVTYRMEAIVTEASKSLVEIAAAKRKLNDFLKQPRNGYWQQKEFEDEEIEKAAVEKSKER